MAKEDIYLTFIEGVSSFNQHKFSTKGKSSGCISFCLINFKAEIKKKRDELLNSYITQCYHCLFVSDASDLGSVPSGFLAMNYEFIERAFTDILHIS